MYRVGGEWAWVIRIDRDAIPALKGVEWGRRHAQRGTLCASVSLAKSADDAFAEAEVVLDQLREALG